MIRGTGRLANIAGHYYPDERKWEFSELVYPESPENPKMASWKENSDLSACDFPVWVKERLLAVFIPKMQRWFDRLIEDKSSGRAVTTHSSNYPSGNPRMDYKHWSEFMKETGYVCTTCMNEIGVRKARRATFIRANDRVRYGVDCFCDEHKPAK